ncbi:M66 family metalloprotease [Vibrio owensii]|uniref:M66 family metalloprotease n=1 Tax=Vibrio owensii TaxID=696485 RepID=UPI0023F9025E|nr:M66 family metalloprotease [Vibrio owensii]
MIVNPYETVKLNEVMLPDGRLLTELDPSTGTWHKGDMRAYTTKILMSHGINLANYGINSSTAISERAHPYTANQITAIAAVGRSKWRGCSRWQWWQRYGDHRLIVGK